jgi:hypothetical protein
MPNCVTIGLPEKAGLLTVKLQIRTFTHALSERFTINYLFLLFLLFALCFKNNKSHARCCLQCFFLSVRQMPRYNSQRLGTANTLPNLLFVVLFVILVVLLLIVMFYVLFMCKCVLPPGVNPIAVDKYINTNTSSCKL